MKREGGVIDARLVPGAAGLVGTTPAGECTYAVVDPGRDKRGRPRQRTKLRTGKLLDGQGRFLTECLIHDRSEEGGRLKLPGGTPLPSTLQLFDDQSATLLQADLVWRTGREAGLRFRPAPATARSRALEAEMRRRYYAVRD